MKMNDSAPGWRSLRAWMLLAVMVAAWFLEDPVELFFIGPIRRAAGLHMIVHGEMALVPYSLLILVRLAWNAALLCLAWKMLRRPQGSFPVRDQHGLRKLMGGLLVGIVVMAACILAILAMGDATVTVHPQPLASALVYSTGWLVFGMLGAAGEELYGRGAVLLVAERFVGWRGAVLVSGILFFIFHLDNPGVSPFWLLRLCLQGMLLAYSVYRTQSLWWAIGYHAGWNWIGAPVFGSAGSGYLNQGHLFDFVPHGPDLVTGGAVGPEGSVFAYLAMAAAFGLLLATTRRQHVPR